MSEPRLEDGPPVPLMVEGIIDADTLRQLFTDLSLSARILKIREKGGASAYTMDEEPPPEIALDRLLSGATRAVQVHYQFAGFEWADTMLRLPSGFRVVRCRYDSGS